PVRRPGRMAGHVPLRRPTTNPLGGHMARNYYTLEPDRMYRLGHHYTSGRGGAGIEFITRHHLMYIGGVKAVVDNIWNTRQASAHVVVDPVGEWGQAVYDRDTAWANANAWANARTIAIEHSNNT